jgi:hypothetical protein
VCRGDDAWRRQKCNFIACHIFIYLFKENTTDYNQYNSHKTIELQFSLDYNPTCVNTA